MGNYTIEARQLSIGPAAHDFWVLKNDQNQIIAELHGFAFSPSKGKTIPIGFRDEDKLQAYVIPYTDEYIKSLPHDLFKRWQEEVGGYYAHDNQNSKEIYTGPDALDRWNTAVAAIHTINEQNLTYPKFGGLGKLYGLLGEPANSNSVYSTFADIMGITAYDFPWVLEPGFDERISLGDSLSSRPPTTLIEDSNSIYFASMPSIFSQLPELWQSLTEIAGAVQEIEGVGNQMESLVAALKSGNDLQIYQSTVGLLQSLDASIHSNSEAYQAFSKEYGQEIGGTLQLAGAIGSLIGLQKALDDGDGWAIAQNATAMVASSIRAYNWFSDPKADSSSVQFAGGAAYAGAASSLVGLGMSIRNFSEVMQSGSDIAKVQATLSVVQSGLSTYVAVAQATAALTGVAISAATSALCSAMPAIGCAIGVAQGLLAMADGDIQGGAEQIALSIATYVLYCIPVYGWIAAIALQLGSATRSCDGQIIDTDNIREFTGELSPGGEFYADASIASVEKPAQWATDVYEGNLFLSPYNVEMYEEIGVEIPEDMHAEFAFAQANAEFFNPLRYAGYFQDLDEMSLADIWDSLYISQGIAATIDQIKNSPDFIKSSFRDTPSLAVDLIESLKEPGKILGLGKFLFGKSDQPQASASFTLGEDGQIETQLSGDKGMRETVNAFAPLFIEVMEAYRQSGGRLEIDGMLPCLTMVDGGSSSIAFRNESGGKVSVRLDDMSGVLEELQTVLIARDRGERLESAVQVARDVHGAIDLAMVDAIMAGYGFTKNGITYTYGETGDLRGYSAGSGVLRGGGNAGPQGQHFTATAVQSLPLREEQLPGQRMGEILKVIGLDNTFSGVGTELLLMALGLSGGLAGLAAGTAAAAPLPLSLGNGRPLSPDEARDAAAEPDSLPAEDPALFGNSARGGRQADEIAPSGATSLAATRPWLEPLPPLESIGTPLLHDPHDWLELRGDGSRSGWRGRPDSDDLEPLAKAGAAASNAASPANTPQAAGDGQAEPRHSPGESFSGYRLGAEEAAALPEGPPPADGPIFRMAADTLLRFLFPELSDDLQHGQYGETASSPRFVSFGAAVGGTVFQDANGDCRFQPSPGFTGTASFSYLLEDASGRLIEKHATIIVDEVNRPPALEDDRFSLAEGEPFPLARLLANDHDPDGDALFVDHLSGLSGGRVALCNGELTFLPDLGQSGEVTFAYWAGDGSAYPAMARVTLSYGDTPTPPAAQDDRFLILEGRSLTVSARRLLNNDREYDGQPLTLVSLGPADHGSVELMDDGAIRFTPAADFSGLGAGFSYTVTDGSGLYASAYVAVEVQDLRQPPQVVASSREPIYEDSPLAFTAEEIATFVFDPDGDRLRFEAVDNVRGGSFVASAGLFTLIPTDNFAGTASFDYVVSDNHRGTASGHLEFAILPVNDAVTVGVDNLSTAEDLAVSVPIAELLANDHDPDGPSVLFAGLGPAEHGTVEVRGDEIRFTPDADYFGNEAGFTCLVADDQGLISSGRVAVAVAPRDDAPTFTTLSLTLLEDSPLFFDEATVARFASDSDGDALRVSAIDSASGGTVSSEAGLFTFTPDANYHGPGEMRLTISDGTTEATAILQLTILPVDDPATLPTVDLATAEDEAVSLTTLSLLAGAFDQDGDLRFAGVVDLDHGQVADDGQGTLVFTPDADYCGTAGFTYAVEDLCGGRTLGHVAVSVLASNDAPQQVAATLLLNEDRPLLFDGDTLARFIADRDGEALTLLSLIARDDGSVSHDGALYTYTPQANAHGPGQVEFLASDPSGATVAGTLDLEIRSVDDPTRFGVDSLITDEEEAVSIAIADLLANDHDDDGPLTFIGIAEERHGTVALDGGLLRFVPDRDYSGDAAGFAYRVEDEEGHQATSWVGVEVRNIPDAPVVIADRLHWREDTPLVFTPEEIAKFLYDGDGEDFAIETADEVTGGVFTTQGGLPAFIPLADYYGEAGFSYQARNSAGETVAGRLAIFLAPVNDLPAVAPLFRDGVEGEALTLEVADLLAQGSDTEDGADLRFSGFESSCGGDVSIDREGRVHFLPDSDFFGDGAFLYRLVDSEGGVGIGRVDIAIAGVNDAPVATDDERILAWSNGGWENVYRPSTFTANDFDVDGDPLQLVAVGPAEYGSVSLDPSGLLRYVAPEDDWVGVDRFTYEISDGSGLTATATAWLDVRINTPPDVYAELLLTEEDVRSAIPQATLLANDSDIDGDAMTITAVDQAEHCQVSLQADGSILFTPEQNFNSLHPGQAYFRYTVSDGISEPVWTYAMFDIAPVNDAPILQGERLFGAVEDNSFSFAVADLMANDSDVEMANPWESDAISFAGVGGAGHGSIGWDQGSGTIFYAPDANFCGVDTFSYAVVDSYGASSVAVSEIFVQPVNDLPVVEEDIASPAEDSVWNSYSIDGLLANDFDIDGDRLSIVDPRVVEGDAEVTMSGGDLRVKPAFREDRVVIAYNVSDGNGGVVASRLTIPDIREHNFAPLFSGLYDIAWKNSYTVWFNFHASDPNGGNTWGDPGEIVGISCSAPSEGSLTDEGYTFKFKGDTEEATLTLTVTDTSGASGTIFVEVGRLSREDGYHHYTPVVLDLDGDGVELLDIAAGIAFDWNGDGQPQSCGWVGGDDGLLAWDLDGDGVVRSGRELSFAGYLAGATTDLEGLRHFDSDSSGSLDSGDTAWKEFGVWRDGDNDGICSPGEFAALEHMGITAISLTSDEQIGLQQGNLVFGMGSYAMRDGTVGLLGDVGLAKGSEGTQSFAETTEEGAPGRSTPLLLVPGAAGESLAKAMEEETVSPPSLGQATVAGEASKETTGSESSAPLDNTLCSAVQRTDPSSTATPAGAPLSAASTSPAVAALAPTTDPASQEASAGPTTAMAPPTPETASSLYATPPPGGAAIAYANSTMTEEIPDEPLEPCQGNAATQHDDALAIEVDRLVTQLLADIASGPPSNDDAAALAPAAATVSEPLFDAPAPHPPQVDEEAIFLV